MSNYNTLKYSHAILGISLGALALWLIIYKALYIPLTHDEPATALHYYNYSVWEIMMYPDVWPNNHILNTLLTKLSINIFGKEQWAMRLPNVLSYLLYFYASFKISRYLFPHNLLLFVAGILLFNGNLFLLDFFSLCRGYGMSNALLLVSTLFFLEGYLHKKERGIWIALGFSILASYANFTVLLFWCSVSIVSGIFFYNQYLEDKNIKRLFGKWGIIVGINLAYLALIMTPIHKMNSTNQFVYWQSNGFFKDTLLSLVTSSFYNLRWVGIKHEHVAMLLAASFWLMGAYLVYLWIRGSWREVSQKPLFIAFILLGFTVLVNLMQTILLKTPNLTTRTTLIYYPLIILLILTFLAKIEAFVPTITTTIGVVVICLAFFQFTKGISLTSVREWDYDEGTFEVLNILQKEQKDPATPLTLRTSWLFHRSFNFYKETGKANWIDLGDYNKEIDTVAKPQFYYIFQEDYPKLEKNYVLFKTIQQDSRILLKRRW